MLTKLRITILVIIIASSLLIGVYITFDHILREHDRTILNNAYDLFCIKISKGMPIYQVKEIIIEETGEYKLINTNENQKYEILELSWEKAINEEKYPNIFMREENNLLLSVIFQYTMSGLQDDVNNYSCTEINELLDSIYNGRKYLIY